MLQTGKPLPRIIAQQSVTVPGPDAPVVTFSVPVDVEDGRWVILRICDPSVQADGRATGDYAAAGSAIAYAAPFFLEPSLLPV